MFGTTGCQLASVAVLSLPLWAGVPPSAWAEATITGTPDLVRVEATNATVAELLSGLHDKFGLFYRSGKLLDEKIEGTYAGSLTSVVRRLLVNYDYVLSRRSDGEKEALVVAVLDKSNSPLQPSRSSKSSSFAQPGIVEPPQIAGPNNQNTKNNQENQNNIAPIYPAPAANTQQSVGGILQSPVNASLAPPGRTPSQSPASATTRFGYPSTEGIATTIQRANANLQALVQALNRVGR